MKFAVLQSNGQCLQNLRPSPLNRRKERARARTKNLKTGFDVETLL